MSDKVVTVYTKDNCVQCNATYKDLDKKKVEFETEDIYENLELVESLGYKAAPVVTVSKNGQIVDHWAGFRPDKILELV